MIDRIGFPVSDYERAKAFYVKALAPLNYESDHGGHAGANRLRSPQRASVRMATPDFWIGGEGALNKPVHVAIHAKGPRHRGRLLQGCDRCR